MAKRSAATKRGSFAQRGQRGVDVLPRLRVGEVEHRQLGELQADRFRHGRSSRRVSPTRGPPHPGRTGSARPMRSPSVRPDGHAPDRRRPPAVGRAGGGPPRPGGGRGILVGLSGGVGVGKSTTAAAVSGHLAELHGLPTTVVSSDGFLFTNAELDARGLTARKGFPESYDRDAIDAFIAAVRAGVDPLRGADVRPPLLRRAPRAGPTVRQRPGRDLRGRERAALRRPARPRRSTSTRPSRTCGAGSWQRVLQLRDEAAGVEGAYLAPFAGLDDTVDGRAGRVGVGDDQPARTSARPSSPRATGPTWWWSRGRTTPITEIVVPMRGPCRT